MPGKSSVQTVSASATAQSADMDREGPSGASAPPMDMEDSLLVTTGLPGCPYRVASYSGPTVSNMNPAVGLQLHHPRFLEFIGVPQSACLLYRAPTFGWMVWERSRRWRQQSTCRGTRALCCPIFRLYLSSLRRYIGCRRKCCPSAWYGWCSLQKRSQTCLQHLGRRGPPRTWRRWVCGALRRVRVIPGQCRPRPVTLA